MNHSLIQDSDKTVLSVSGELDAISCPELRPVLDAVVGYGTRTVTVDLSDLRLIDSSGWGPWCRSTSVCARTGARCDSSASRPSPSIFKLLRLDRAFELS